MTKIEYYENEYDADVRETGWYICDYDDLTGPPRQRTGPYETKTQALRMLRHTESVTIEPEPDDAHEGR